MANILLILHSWLRWLVLIGGVGAIVLALLGLLQKRPWQRADNIFGILYTSAFDSQLLLGLIMYIFTSGVTRTAFQDMGAAMASSALRFFVVEHLSIMLVALVLAHIGRARSKKAESDAAKHRQGLIFYGISLLLMLAAIPWPLLEYGRPLFRL